MKNKLFYTIVRPILFFLVKIFFRPKVVGIENIPKDGSFVLAGNHTKWLDPVMLVAIVKRQVHFLAKEELFHGFTKFIVEGMGCISVDRKKKDKNVLINACDCLEKGGVIGIFPEGTINRTDDIIMPFKIGAVKMCSDTDSQLVPFVITGKYKWFGSEIKIEFLKSRKISKNIEKENQKLMSAISSKLEEYFLETGEKIVKGKVGEKSEK